MKITLSTTPLRHGQKNPADLKDEDYKDLPRIISLFWRPSVPYPFECWLSFQSYRYFVFPKIKNNIECSAIKFNCTAIRFLLLIRWKILFPITWPCCMVLLIHRTFRWMYRAAICRAMEMSRKYPVISPRSSRQIGWYFQKERPEFEDKWDDLKIFIQYGMLTDEKFYERAENLLCWKCKW